MTVGLLICSVVCVEQILLLNNVEELHRHIDQTQLTPDLGGSAQYDHHQWIQHRAVRPSTFSVALIQIIFFWGGERAIFTG